MTSGVLGLHFRCVASKNSHSQETAFNASKAVLVSYNVKVLPAQLLGIRSM